MHNGGMVGIYAHELKKGPWILLRRQSNESDHYRPARKKGVGYLLDGIWSCRT